jgi:DNA-binding PadR family transcriptional regulator
MPPDPRTFLPLRPVDLHLLLALSHEEKHGYGLVRAIAESSRGLVELDPGNLYRVIKRLLATGLVAESQRRPVTAEGEERRRYYRLTALGGRVLAEELRRLHQLVTSSSSRAIVKGWVT